jgi:hypothetical protein
LNPVPGHSEADDLQRGGREGGQEVPQVVILQRRAG